MGGVLADDVQDLLDAGLPSGVGITSMWSTLAPHQLGLISDSAVQADFGLDCPISLWGHPHLVQSFQGEVSNHCSLTLPRPASDSRASGDYGADLHMVGAYVRFHPGNAFGDMDSIRVAIISLVPHEGTPPTAFAGRGEWSSILDRSVRVFLQSETPDPPRVIMVDVGGHHDLSFVIRRFLRAHVCKACRGPMAFLYDSSTSGIWISGAHAKLGGAEAARASPEHAHQEGLPLLPHPVRVSLSQSGARMLPSLFLGRTWRTKRSRTSQASSSRAPAGRF